MPSLVDPDSLHDSQNSHFSKKAPRTRLCNAFFKRMFQRQIIDICLKFLNIWAYADVMWSDAMKRSCSISCVMRKEEKNSDPEIGKGNLSSVYKLCNNTRKTKQAIWQPYQILGTGDSLDSFFLSVFLSLVVFHPFHSVSETQFQTALFLSGGNCTHILELYKRHVILKAQYKDWVKRSNHCYHIIITFKFKKRKDWSAWLSFEKSGLSVLMETGACRLFGPKPSFCSLRTFVNKYKNTILGVFSHLVKA